MRDKVETLWLRIQEINPDNTEAKILAEQGIDALNKGEIRAAEKTPQGWLVHEWVKKLILIYFRTTASRKMSTGYSDPLLGTMNVFDKIGLKTAEWDTENFENAGFRMAPGAIVRTGTYVSPSAVLMPSFVNIGAYIGRGTMIDTWATIGSCAQIGANCHISGGAGIGGVLEPLNAKPVIIEDDVFIGARSEIAEGVVVRQGAVISMGVFISGSTPIINCMTGEVSYGEVPEGAVVLSGTRPVQLESNNVINMPCALIIKKSG